MWQPEMPCTVFGQPMSHFQEWQFAFIDEWLRLAEGCADLEQTADAANELYPRHGARNPVTVAREEWGAEA